MQLEFSLPIAVGDFSGNEPYMDLVFMGAVIKLNGSFEAEHWDRLPYLKKDEGDNVLKRNVID